MIALGLKFTAGRFHATPWGRHVNEAAPEWPPSPWRLLRALVATWKRKLNEELTITDVEPVLRSLIAPPQFALPPAALGHSRHFMPWFKKGPDDRTMIFDGFVALEPSASVVALWPDAALKEPQRRVLSRLLDNIGFLGRAESWCDAQLLTQESVAKLEVNSIPTEEHRERDGYGIVRVLCADPETAFADEHVVALEYRKASRGNQQKTETMRRPLYDPSWHLCIETERLQAERWSDPPGAKWVHYMRPNDCFKIERRLVARIPNTAHPQVARFALDSSVLPLVSETLPVAESARRMLMGIYGRLSASRQGLKGKSEIFSGKDAEGRPLTKHEHAYYLPTDENGDGRLDHLTVMASDGFDPLEVKAIDSLRELKSHKTEKSGHPVRVILLGLGSLEDYHPFPLRASTRWLSATPFIVTRHLKKRGTRRDPVQLWNDPKKFIEEVLREELRRWLIRHPLYGNVNAEDVDIAPLVDDQGTFRIGDHKLRPIQFQRFRQKPGDDGGRRPSGAFHLTFPQPVSGPICLGYSSHFGMGLFLPSSPSKEAS